MKRWHKIQPNQVSNKGVPACSPLQSLDVFFQAIQHQYALLCLWRLDERAQTISWLISCKTYSMVLCVCVCVWPEDSFVGLDLASYAPSAAVLGSSFGLYLGCVSFVLVVKKWAIHEFSLILKLAVAGVPVGRASMVRWLWFLTAMLVTYYFYCCIPMLDVLDFVHCRVIDVYIYV